MSKQLKKTLDAFSQTVADELRKSGFYVGDSKRAVNSLQQSVKALEKLATHMASLDYQSENPCAACGRRGLSAEAAGKTLAYLAKVVNEQARLLEFGKGKPDSRTEVTGLADLYKLLNPDEFKTVSTIIDAASKRLESPEGQA